MANEVRLIDAKEALKKVCENCCCDFEECKQVGFCVDYENINQLPTVDAVPVVHGQWIISSDGYYPYCSECKVEPKNGEMTNYCPNCGAKMWIASAPNFW